MAEKPLFSVLTVSLNALEKLKKTSKSLQRQAAADFEWIVIDGASSDGTKNWLAARETPWISEPDNGLYDAMNKGIRKARGDYILFLNAGDVLAEENTLQKIAAALDRKKEKPDFIYGDSLEMQENENTVYKTARTYTNIRRGMFTHHQAMFYRRERLLNFKYDLRYRIAADYDLTCRFLKGAEHILYCPFAVCIFEGSGLSQKEARRGRKEEFEIRRRLKITGDFQNFLIGLFQTAAWCLRTLIPRLYWVLKRPRKLSAYNSQSVNAQN